MGPCEQDMEAISSFQGSSLSCISESCLPFLMAGLNRELGTPFPHPQPSVPKLGCKGAD